MASPSTVITLGYGSFGSVNLLPTLGYGIGEVTADTAAIQFAIEFSHVQECSISLSHVQPRAPKFSHVQETDKQFSKR